MSRQYTHINEIADETLRMRNEGITHPKNNKIRESRN